MPTDGWTAAGRRTPLALLADAACFGVTLGVFGFFASRTVDFVHDGVAFKTSLDVANGAVLFKDTFSFYGPLTTWLQAATLLVFGKTLLALKWLTVVFYAGIAVLLRRLWSWFLSPLATGLAVATWILLAPFYVWTMLAWASVYALFFQLVATHAVVAHFVTGRRPAIGLAGVAVTLTFLCKQPVGLCTAVALGFALLVLSPPGAGWRALRAYGTGIAATSLLFMLYLSISGTGHAYWTLNIAGPFLYGSQWSDDYKALAILKMLFPTFGAGTVNPGLPAHVWTLLPVATLTLFTATGWTEWRRRRTDAAFAPATAVFLTACLGIASWAQYFPILCIRHVYWGGTVMIGLAYCGLEAAAGALSRGSAGRLPTARPTARRFEVAVLVVGCVVVFGEDVALRVRSAVDKATRPYVSSDVAGMAGMRVPEDDARLFRDLQQVIDSHPASTLVGDSYYSYLLMTFGPQGIMFVPYEVQGWYPDYHRELAHYLQTHDAIYVGTLRSPTKQHGDLVLWHPPYRAIHFPK